MTTFLPMCTRRLAMTDQSLYTSRTTCDLRTLPSLPPIISVHNNKPGLPRYGPRAMGLACPVLVQRSSRFERQGIRERGFPQISCFTLHYQLPHHPLLNQHTLPPRVNGSHIRFVTSEKKEAWWEDLKPIVFETVCRENFVALSCSA